MGSPHPTFSIRRKIRFGHTDPAGIVYYPNYFDMFNATVEDFFDACLGSSFQKLKLEDKVVTPLAYVESNFIAPCRIGDSLLLALSLISVGRTSFAVTIEGTVEGSPCVRARLVHVFISTDDGRPALPPPDVAERMRSLAAPSVDEGPGTRSQP